MRKVCDAFFGPIDRQDELLDITKQQQEELERLRQQVEALEVQMKIQEQQLSLEISELEAELNVSFTDLQQYIDSSTFILRQDLEQADEQLRLQIERNRERINRALRRIRRLRSSMNDVVSDIATLQGYSSIVQIHDPCGPSGGFDEVVLELSTGEFLAYFEDGGKRFLSLLSNGNYRTTDRQNCSFTVPL